MTLSKHAAIFMDLSKLYDALTMLVLVQVLIYGSWITYVTSSSQRTWEVFVHSFYR